MELTSPELVGTPHEATTVTTHEAFDAPDRTYTYEELLTLALTRVQAGKHLWTIPLVFHVADPEAAMEELELDGTNLVGPGSLRCLFCQTVYVTGLADAYCQVTAVVPTLEP